MDEYLSIIRTKGDRQGALNVARLPDVVKFVTIGGALAKQIAHFALHREDLQFVVEALQEITRSKSEVVRRALWDSALVTFIKCFVGGSARIRLSETKIFGDNKQALACFAHFATLRNKHVVHDENALSQCATIAGLNDGTKDFKIEEVLSLTAETVTLQQTSWQSLLLCAEAALKWTISKHDQLCKQLTTELEKCTMDELTALPEAQMPEVPEPSAVFVRRNGF